MSASWEWRSFQPGQARPLLQLAAQAAAHLNLPPPVEVMPESDTYLVIRGLQHNLKLRRGSLEVKRLVKRLRTGYSLWQDKEIWQFPLAGADVQELWSLLPVRRRKAPELISSAGALLAALEVSCGDLAVLQLYKHRIRLDNGRARLEVADLELPGASRWLSYCSDGYDLTAVQEIVRRSRIESGNRVMSYVDFLRDAVWWFPGIANREVMAIDAR